MGSAISKNDIEEFGHKIMEIDRIYNIIYSVAFISIVLYWVF